MSPALAFGCFLLTVPTPCDPRTDYYIPQAQQIPESHLRMVASISLWEQPNGDAGWPSRTIRLPATNHFDPTVLSHELYHVVAAVLGLNESYAETFWPAGRIRGTTTPYGRTDHFEDIAECGSAIVIQQSYRCDTERIQWLKQRMFEGTNYET